MTTSWFTTQVINDTRLGLFAEHPIAYFSAEFALSEKLPIYSGGLGVLAGDVIREAADLAIPFVGVGLFYQRGYFLQTISKTGQQEEYPYINPEEAGLILVRNADNTPLTVQVPIASRQVSAQIWQWRVGTVSVYLLDTNIAPNSLEDREITAQLYGGDIHMRIKQELVLGIGGERALLALDIHPWAYHMNEGHSAFAILEITHHVMAEKHISFEEAFKIAHDKMIFTNHTLVVAGNDVFTIDMVKEYLGTYAKQLGISVDQIFGLGKTEGNRFGMTHFAARQSFRINAVSKLHEKVAKTLWPEFTMTGITNGVHIPTWVAESIQLRCAVRSPYINEQTVALTDGELWGVHEDLRTELIRFVQKHTGVSFNTKALTLTWARRFATYKRPEVLFSEIETLKKLATSAHGALQIIIAGKAHPKDTEGKAVIARIVETIEKENLKNWVVFLPNYDMKIARFLVQGSDVWLNTPIRGKEASGTSGMKAGANGVLQCSICDGWFDEVCDLNFGWQLDSERTAQSLYSVLEGEILPLFYERDNLGVPRQWVKKMRQTMVNIWQNYSATRMMSEYFQTLYLPTLTNFSEDYHVKKVITGESHGLA